MYEVSIIENVLGRITANTYTFTSIPQREVFLRMCEGEEGTVVIVHNSKPKELQEVI
jgi:hypothetical protein